jgi:hypothetical protein
MRVMFAAGMHIGKTQIKRIFTLDLWASMADMFILVDWHK